MTATATVYSPFTAFYLERRAPIFLPAAVLTGRRPTGFDRLFQAIGLEASSNTEYLSLIPATASFGMTVMEVKKATCIYILLASFCLWGWGWGCELDPEDRASLLVVRSSMEAGSGTHTLLSFWQGTQCSGWAGISCDFGSGRVVSMVLTALSLSGRLPLALCNLSSLHTLILSHNSVSGPIPPCLASLPALQVLDLSHNQLGGAIPDAFDGLAKLRQPLGFLSLASNHLSGTLPCFSAVAPTLYALNLTHNSIQGGIPSCLASLHMLTHLNLSHNLLAYGISPRLVFPDSLLVLDLSFNQLSGPLPINIAVSTDKSFLILLDLSYNHFSGDIPPNITQLKSLQALLLSHNSLTGPIPSTIGNLTYLQLVDLSHNYLSGPIPLDIVGCFQLLALILSHNDLSGELQPELDALDSLRILDVSNNHISGELPLTFAGLKSLEFVDFSSNNLSGTLNDAVTKWPNLKFLSLARNNFVGNLPAWLFSFEAIQMIDFSYNKFSGSIPGGNFNTSFYFNSLIANTTPDEALTSSDVKISIWVTHKNELDLSFEPRSPVGIDLSDNLLQGEIPGGVFGLQGLEYLNLSYNRLGGQLPGLDRMLSVMALDLSHNSLSGQVPGNISSLEHLRLLNLSYNSLFGSVQGLRRFPGAFAGNPGLCVESASGRCEGERLSRKKDAEGLISVWVFSVSAVVTFYSTVLALFCSARARAYILQTKI